MHIRYIQKRKINFICSSKFVYKRKFIVNKNWLVLRKPKKVLIKVISAQSYGGRNEIVRAIKKLSNIKNITEEAFSKTLDTKGIPDPDLIIRTGGEMRLSNFLLWQSAYSELFFTKTLWPEFSKLEFLNILKEYAGRERRNGK